MNLDEELLNRIAAGEKEAMRIFFERYQRPLFGFLRSRGADAQAADDATQEAMMEVWRTAERYEGRATAKTWLFTIARNKFIDQQRKLSRFTVVEEVPEIVDEAVDAEAILISTADQKRVRLCLSKLQPSHLTAIRLAFFEELTYAEISEIESVPEGTIKSRVFHAKKLLLRCLGKR